MLFGAAKAPVTVSLHVQRTSFDLLDVLAVQVAAHNSTQTPVSVTFPSPNEYVIEVVRGDTVLFSSMPPSPPPGTSIPAHSRALVPGPNTIATYEWNELTKDGASLQPGRYSIRVHLTNAGVQPSASTTVVFVAPIPVSAVAKLKPGDQITVGGRVDATLMHVTDSTGTIALSRKLLGAPDAPLAVRGYIVVQPDGTRILDVTRWAPLR